MAHGDETIFEGEVSYAQPVTVVQRSSWKVWVGILMALLLVTFAYCIPVFQQQYLLKKMRGDGAVLYTTEKDLWLLNDLAEIVQYNTPWQIPLLVDVQGANLTAYPTDDNTLLQISRWPKLAELVVQKANVTDQGLYALVANAESLRTLLVINCPHITRQGIDEIEVLKPGLEIRFRGTAFLGIQGSDHSQQCAVLEVVANSPADNAGIEEHDIIQEIDHEAVNKFEQLVRALSEHQPGDVVELKILDRHQKMKQLTVTLGGWPD